MTPLLQTAGWTLIHFVWQGTAIAGATCALLRLTRYRSAAARYVIACMSLAAMLAAPIATARLLLTGAESPSGAQTAQGDVAPLKSGVSANLMPSLVSVLEEHAAV